ncbi:MAG: flagellar biosynthetic protein FliQ [Alphaproteobacteria bacterium]|nr:flagellar biosynthetic protein FliQ [Alphaproteobacteria bacterium]
MTTLYQTAHGALLTIFYVAGPILAVIMMIGIIVGVFLAATQINEPTISFVPKFLGTGLAVVVLGPWLLRQLESFTIAVLAGLPRILQ